MQPDRAAADPGSASAFARNTTAARNLFSIPKALKALFEKVPLRVYGANELPQSAPGRAAGPSLYVFARARDVEAGWPSFNPGCLKWQVGFSVLRAWGVAC